jgi:MFS family permease
VFKELLTQQHSKDPVVDRSLRHSIYDGITYSVMTGAAENYFSAFAILLKATTSQIGVLASLPPLLASFTQIFSAWLGRRTGHRKQIIVFGAIAQATTLVPLTLLPLLFPDQAVALLVVCAVVYYIGPNLGSPQWSSLMGDIVPEARRGRFFALRTQLASVASFSALIVAGLILQLFHTVGYTYWGFVAIFALACAARLQSAFHLSQMHDPPGHVAALESAWHLDLWRGIRSTDLVPFSIFFASMQFAVGIASPFFVLYMLRDLKFSYVEFMINSAASVLLQFLTLNRWGRLSDLFGNRLILMTTGVIIPFMPTLWIFSTNYYYLLAVQCVSGLVWAGFSLSASNFVFDLTPPQRRATLMAAHNVFAALGVFVGAVIGGYLGTHLPNAVTLFGRHFEWLSVLYGVFVISALTRLAVAITFLPRIREVRSVRRMSMTGLIFRVTRVAPVSQLIFEIVGTLRRGRNDD